jgi:hypothetical protein
MAVRLNVYETAGMASLLQSVYLIMGISTSKQIKQLPTEWTSDHEGNASQYSHAI